MLLLVLLLYRQSFWRKAKLKGTIFFMTSYNKKIVRTSSYIEIWEYEKPMFSKGKSILDTNAENKEKSKNAEHLTN